MSVGATQSALMRKLGAGRPATTVQAMTLTRAWRLALVHGFSEAAGLHLTLEDHSFGTVDPPDMPALMEHGDLAVLLEGANGFGVALLDVQLMAGLIEAQTMGRVLVRPAMARVPTPTDGAMIADPLDRALTLFETHAAGIDGGQTCFGMRFATPLVDGRAVTMALPDETHLLHDLTVVFGGGDRSGRLRLILPAAVAKPEIDTAPDPEWNLAIERNLMGAEAQLTAVLTRLHLPIDQVTGWQVGSQIPISGKSLTQIALISCTGSILAQGRLGQSSGQKAVMLNTIAVSDDTAALPPPDAPGAGVGALMTGRPAFGQSR